MDGLLVFLTVPGAWLAHAPVLRWNLMPALDRPIDGGATARGKRLFGDNKTWRGALVLGGGVVVATLLLSRLDAWWSALPADVRSGGPLLLGALVGLGVVVGELPNSFVKRQLDIEAGARRRSALGLTLTIWDQADFVPFVALALLPLWTMPLTTLMTAFVAVTVVHLGVNVVGYAIGARTAPI